MSIYVLSKMTFQRTLLHRLLLVELNHAAIKCRVDNIYKYEKFHILMSVLPGRPLKLCKKSVEILFCLLLPSSTV